MGHFRNRLFLCEIINNSTITVGTANIYKIDIDNTQK